MEHRESTSVKLDENISIMSTMQSLVLGEQLDSIEVETLREFKAVRDYLDLPMNDPAENELKKVVATAIVTAHRLGALRLPEGCQDAESVASIVDEGLTRMKTAYQVANGIINPIDATEIINDRATVRVAAVVDMVTKKLEEKAQRLIDVAEATVLSKVDIIAEAVKRAGFVVGAYVVKVFPPAKAVIPVIREVQKFVAPAIKQAVKKGIKFIAESARSFVTKTAEKVGSFAKRVLTKLVSGERVLS